MDDKINDVIAEDIEPVQLIIQGKGEIPDIPRLEAVIDRQPFGQRRVRKVAEVSDNRVPDNEILSRPTEKGRGRYWNTPENRELRLANR